jgi:hypothetical protein
MNRHSRRGRIRLMLTALLTALAVCLTATAAFADPPNESTDWQIEDTQDGAMQTPNAPAEAYNTAGALLQVWRGDDDGIYLSLGHGPDLRLGTDLVGLTYTYAAPRVVPWSANDFALFHTGTDGHIYWMPLDINTIEADEAEGNGYILPYWQALPGTLTDNTLSPDVTTAGQGSENMLVAYRSATDNQLYSQWFAGGGGGGWQAPQEIGNAMSPSTPSILWNQALSVFVLFFRGNDNGLWVTFQSFGQPWLGEVYPITNAVTLGGGPSSMALENGDMQVAMRDVNGHLWYLQYYGSDHTWTSPTLDNSLTSDETIDSPPQLSGTQGSQIWALISLSGYAYWKQSMMEKGLPNNMTAGQVSAARAAFVRSLTSAARRTASMKENNLPNDLTAGQRAAFEGNLTSAAIR